jgi:hypothetical protein
MSTRFNMFGVRSRSTTWPDELSRPLLQMKAILFLHSCRDPPPPDPHEHKLAVGLWRFAS